MNPRELAEFFELPADGSEDGPSIISRMTYDVRLLHAILVVLLAIEERIIGADPPSPDPPDPAGPLHRPAGAPSEPVDATPGPDHSDST